MQNENQEAKKMKELIEFLNWVKWELNTSTIQEARTKARELLEKYSNERVI